MDDIMEKLQEWYLSQCNGEWEHAYGIKIETLDNPGWSVEINLKDTLLAKKHFEAIESKLDNANDWLVCKTEDRGELDGRFFLGYCGPSNLGKVVKIFLDWSR